MPSVLLVPGFPPSEPGPSLALPPLPALPPPGPGTLPLPGLPTGLSVLPFKLTDAVSLPPK